MPDVVDPATRSRMMSGIRGKDTKPEVRIRKGLHRLGFRYRLHDPRLPGKPDLVFPKYRAVILINGCFWHGHGCHMFKWPVQRADFWRAKIGSNRERDARHARALAAEEWRVLIIWECSLKGRTRLGADRVTALAAEWLRSGSTDGEISGSGE